MTLGLPPWQTLPVQIRPPPNQEEQSKYLLVRCARGEEGVARDATHSCPRISLQLVRREPDSTSTSARSCATGRREASPGLRRNRIEGTLLTSATRLSPARRTLIPSDNNNSLSGIEHYLGGYPGIDAFQFGGCPFGHLWGSLGIKDLKVRYIRRESFLGRRM